MDHIAAFFDIDGTLAQPPSLEWRLALRLAIRGELTCGAGARWIGRSVGAALSLSGDAIAREVAFARNKTWLRGMSCASVQQSAQAIAECAPLRFAVAQKIAEHAHSGHPIFLVSGTLAPLARAFATRFAPICEIGAHATELVAAGGKLTGAVCGEPACGQQKAAIIRKIALQYGLDLSRSFAYANSSTDRWFLETVGRPTAVFPDRSLAQISRRRRWPVIAARGMEGGDRFYGARTSANAAAVVED
ncbi:MAG TPA: haloacid dehalogenase-like hydrolase [Candidatus Acidoferrales bacterium]|nr:haloacid dehalogenase-like hydrolase [Candidatus Acidoferrales bacterium]